MIRGCPEERLEMIKDLPAREQSLIYRNMYSCGDADLMDSLEANGAFQPECEGDRRYVRGD